MPQAVQPQATTPLSAAALTPLPTAQSAPADSLAVEPEPKQPVVATAIAQPKASAPAAGEASIRVDVGLLGSLVDLVGELVLARNQLQSTVNSDRPDMLKRPDLLKVVQRIRGHRWAPVGGHENAHAAD